MKQKSLLKTMLLLFALIAGSSSVWAEEITYSFSISSSDFNSTSYAANDNEKTTKAVCTTDATKKMDVKWTSSNCMLNSSNIQFKKNAGYIYNSTNLGTVTDISITSTAGGYSIFYGTTENPTSGTSTGSGKGFFKIKENNTATGKVSEIVVTFKFTIPTVTFNNSSVIVGETLDLNDLFTSNSGGDVTYTITAGDTYGSIGVDGHTLTGLAEGSMTVKASVAQKGIYAPDEATATITVASASSPNADLSTSSLNFGEVEVGQTKNMTFTVTPSNLTGNLTIDCNNDKYTVSPTSIIQTATSAQTITVTAAPTAYNDNMAGAITISGGGIASKTVTLSTTPYQVSTVTLSATNGVIQEGGVTKTSITSRVGSTATVTAVPNPGYVFDSWSATGATPASSETAETEFTFTATTATLTANFVVDNRVFVSLEGTDIDDMTGNTGYGEVKTITKNGLTWSTTGYKQNASDQYIQLKAASPYPYVKIPELPGAIQTITFSVTNTSASSKGDATNKTSGTLIFRTATGGTNIVSGGGSSTNEIVLDFSSLAQNYSTGYIVLTGGGTRIWDITVAYIPAEDFNVSITDAKYATFSDYVARNFSTSGIEVYKAASDGTKVNLTKINDGIVPAYTGVVLFSETVKTDEPIPVVTTAGTGDFSGNELVGINVRTVVNATESTKTNYILSNEAAGVGFYKAVDGKYLGAHKAYLSTATAASAPSFLGFDGETTGINAVNGSEFKVNGEYFNLNGQRVAEPTKGLYIVNGKKVVIK